MRSIHACTCRPKDPPSVHYYSQMFKQSIQGASSSKKVHKLALMTIFSPNPFLSHLILALHHDDLRRQHLRVHHKRKHVHGRVHQVCAEDSEELGPGDFSLIPVGRAPAWLAGCHVSTVPMPWPEAAIEMLVLEPLRRDKVMEITAAWRAPRMASRHRVVFTRRRSVLRVAISLLSLHWLILYRPYAGVQLLMRAMLRRVQTVPPLSTRDLLLRAVNHFVFPQGAFLKAQGQCPCHIFN